MEVTFSITFREGNVIRVSLSSFSDDDLTALIIPRRRLDHLYPVGFGVEAELVVDADVEVQLDAEVLERRIGDFGVLVDIIEVDAVPGEPLAIGRQPLRIASAPENQADVVTAREQLQRLPGIRQILIPLLALIARVQDRVVNIHDHIDLLPPLLLLPAERRFECFNNAHRCQLINYLYFVKLYFSRIAAFVASS